MKKNPKINKQLATREQELNATFGQIVTTIDDYFHVAPFMFMEGREGAPGEYVFPDFPDRGRVPMFESWIEQWMATLYPGYPEAAESKDAIGLCDYGQKFGFLLGYLMGCKSMGAGTQALLEKAHGFTVRDLSYRRWLARQNEKGK